MLQPPDAFLILVKGVFFLDGAALSGAALPLWGKEVLLGRASPDCQPDFSFGSPYVSRRHATIAYNGETYLLTDLPGNRHGTWLNDKRLTPGIPHEIKDRDRIRLAMVVVVLIFATSASMGGETWDFPAPKPSSEFTTTPSPKPVLVLDPDRREVVLDGRVLGPPLSGRPYALLEVLYENRGRAVSDLDIKKAVWSDYGLGVDGKPLVTDDELTTLVYRLRRSLEPHSTLIRTVPRFGYMLDQAR